MAQLSQAKAELKDAAVFAISNEERAALQQMRDKHSADFITFLSDQKGEVAAKYPGTYPGQTMSQPGTFVIGKDKKVTYAYLNEDYKTRAPTDALLAAVKQAR